MDDANIRETKKKLEELKTRALKGKDEMKTELKAGKVAVNKAHEEMEAKLKKNKEDTEKCLTAKLNRLDSDYNKIMTQIDDVSGQDNARLPTEKLDKLTQILEQEENIQRFLKRKRERTVPAMPVDVQSILERCTLDFENLEIEKTPGFFKCNQKDCQLCSYRCDEKAGCNLCKEHPKKTFTVTENATTFKSTSTGVTHEVDGNYCCTTTHIVYLATCAKCYAQYVGHTEHDLKKAIGDDISPSANQTKMQKHFKESGCGPHNLRALVITQERNREVRKRLKKEWVVELDTKDKDGKNNLKLNKRK